MAGLFTLAREVDEAARPAGFIDVRELIAKLTDEELMATADAYFAGLNAGSEQCYKPFSNPADAVYLTRHLGLLLQAADLFSGADVLDFGCATGWLTLGLAEMGLNATGVDVSPAAVALAEGLKVQRGLRPGSQAQFHAYDGHRLPYPDASFDRVVCFDSFHHVRDQAATLAEMARVLRPGGRIAMLEPGPNHSKTPQSQAEMAQFKVIENDISLPDIARIAKGLGLSPPQVLVQFHKALSLGFDTFQEWSSGRSLPKRDADMLVAGLHRHLTDTQCFYLANGAGSIDSRRPEALGAEMKLVSARPLDGQPNVYELKLQVRNVGRGTWITRPGVRGHVNIGAQVLAADGSVHTVDYQRFAVPGPDVLPGSRAEVVAVVHLPPVVLEGGKLRFDMVAEYVAWFSQRGACNLVEWRP
jgi:SAM-dependent methyltransferase